jgi:hypothetical protein
MKVKLIKRVWGYEPGTELDLTGDRLDLVMSKNYAKAIDDNYKNKAIETVPKNKAKKKVVKKQDFLGSQSFE